MQRHDLIRAAKHRDHCPSLLQSDLRRDIDRTVVERGVLHGHVTVERLVPWNYVVVEEL
jgi:hypothetical protein